MRRLLTHPIALALGLVAIAGLGSGCPADKKKLDQLTKRIESLEKRNDELSRKIESLQRQRGGGAAGNPLGSLGGLMKMAQKLAGGSARTGQPTGRRSLPPDLQKRLDKVIIEGLEKLAKSKDAKNLLKTLMKAMRRDIERKSKRPPPSPPPAP